MYTQGAIFGVDYISLPLDKMLDLPPVDMTSFDPGSRHRHKMWQMWMWNPWQWHYVLRSLKTGQSFFKSMWPCIYIFGNEMNLVLFVSPKRRTSIDQVFLMQVIWQPPRSLSSQFILCFERFDQLWPHLAQNLSYFDLISELITKWATNYAIIVAQRPL